MIYMNCSEELAIEAVSVGIVRLANDLCQIEIKCQLYSMLRHFQDMTIFDYGHIL